MIKDDGTILKENNPIKCITFKDFQRKKIIDKNMEAKQCRNCSRAERERVLDEAIEKLTLRIGWDIPFAVRQGIEDSVVVLKELRQGENKSEDIYIQKINNNPSSF